jgi:hypothetical protein
VHRVARDIPRSFSEPKKLGSTPMQGPKHQNRAKDQNKHVPKLFIYLLTEKLTEQQIQKILMFKAVYRLAIWRHCNPNKRDERVKEVMKDCISKVKEDVDNAAQIIRNDFKEKSKIFEEIYSKTLDDQYKIYQNYVFDEDAILEKCNLFCAQFLLEKKKLLKSGLDDLDKAMRDRFLNMCVKECMPPDLVTDIGRFFRTKFKNDINVAGLEFDDTYKKPISIAIQSGYLLLNMFFSISCLAALKNRSVVAAPFLSATALAWFRFRIYKSDVVEVPRFPMPAFLLSDTFPHHDYEKELYVKIFVGMKKEIDTDPEGFKREIHGLIQDYFAENVDGSSTDARTCVAYIVRSFMLKRFGFIDKKRPLDKQFMKLMGIHDKIFGPLVSEATLFDSSNDAVVSLDRLASLCFNLITGTMLAADYNNQNKQGNMPHIENNSFIYKTISYYSAYIDFFLMLRQEDLKKINAFLLDFFEEEVCKYLENPKKYRFDHNNGYERIKENVLDPLHKAIVIENGVNSSMFNTFWQNLTRVTAAKLAVGNPFATVTQNVMALFGEQGLFSNEDDGLSLKGNYHKTTVSDFVTREKYGVQIGTLDSFLWYLLENSGLTKTNWGSYLQQCTQSKLVRVIPLIRGFPFSVGDPLRSCPYGRIAQFFNKSLARTIAEKLVIEQTEKPSLNRFFIDPFEFGRQTATLRAGTESDAGISKVPSNKEWYRKKEKLSYLAKLFFGCSRNDFREGEAPKPEAYDLAFRTVGWQDKFRDK